MYRRVISPLLTVVVDLRLLGRASVWGQMGRFGLASWAPVFFRLFHFFFLSLFSFISL
jgi:hypothetical protein